MDEEKIPQEQSSQTETIPAEQTPAAGELIPPQPVSGSTDQIRCMEADADMQFEITQIKSAISDISIEAKRSSSEIHEMHRLYHNEFAGRLKSMQDELTQYHDAEKGKAFDTILGAIARIYSNNESLADEIADPKIKRHVKYLLLDLSDLLEEYGVRKQKSTIGDKRNVRHCQIVERIPSDDPAMHDAIAVSHSTGFHKDNRTIIKELVDVYFFDRSVAAPPECAEEMGDDASADVDIE